MGYWCALCGCWIKGAHTCLPRGTVTAVEHGNVYPADTTKMPEPVIVNRADFGEMREAKQQAREAGIREALKAVEKPIESAIETLRYLKNYVEGCALSAEDDAEEAIEELADALTKLRALLPEGEGEKG